MLLPDANVHELCVLSTKCYQYTVKPPFEVSLRSSRLEHETVETLTERNFNTAIVKSGLLKLKIK
jgi:hypothetical protein